MEKEDVDHPMENRELYLLMDLRFMLECTLASYDHLCGMKRAPKHELNRYESIVRKGFLGAADLLQKHEASYPFAFGPCPRVTQLVVYMNSGDSAEAALVRYFNKVRHRIES